jgi:carboxypeptidase C (cathepsin A)
MADNSYNLTLVTPDEKANMDAMVPRCIELIEICQNASRTQFNHTPDNALRYANACVDAQMFCHLHLIAPLYLGTGRNPYDIREPCSSGQTVGCYDFRYIHAFLNAPDVMTILHVNTARVSQWQECNTEINRRFSKDWMQSYAAYVPPLLERGLRVLVYAGDADLMCNWKGNEAWTVALDWSGTRRYAMAHDRPMLLHGKPVGMSRQYQNLAFVRIFDAGHLVPMDQPEVALAMVHRFVRNDVL